MTFFESILKSLKSRMYGIVRSLWRLAIQFFGLPRFISLIRFACPRVTTRFSLPFTENHSCLTNSLLRLYGLQKQGQDAHLALGVKKEDGKLLAHAWIEKEGENSDGQDGFKKLGTL